MGEVLYSLAAPDDETEVRSLLAQCQLPANDISGHLSNFIVARSAGKIAGVIGLEVCGKYGLLRSLAVAPSFRGRGVAGALHTRIFARAILNKLEKLYIFTNTAAGYAAKLGFREIDREGVLKSIRATTEFQILCPETSTCMMLSLVVAGSKS